MNKPCKPCYIIGVSFCVRLFSFETGVNNIGEICGKKSLVIPANTCGLGFKCFRLEPTFQNGTHVDPQEVIQLP